MRRTPQLSIELWQWILRYAISIPEFLDPETYDGIFSQYLYEERLDTLSDETAYWVTERHRRSLQLVSKTWAAYMKTYQHRFVRMLDIFREKIPPESLKCAIRVSFGRYDCKCAEKCANRLDRLYCYQNVWKNPYFSNFCSWTLEDIGPLDKLEIADMMRECFKLADFLIDSQSLCQVKVFLGLDHPSLNRSGRNASSHILGILPKLRNLYAYDIEKFSEIQELASNHRATPGKESVGPMIRVAQNVVTLSLFFHPFQGYYSSPYTLDFPSLRHLRIQYSFTGVDVDKIMQEITIPILKSTHGNIRSIYIQSLRSDPVPPLDIWDLCPKLERFGSTVDQMPPPPSYHPVHTFVSPFFLEEETDMGVFLWPNLQRFTSDMKWADTYPKQPASDEWLQMAAERGIRIEDRNGLTWEEYTIMKTTVQLDSDRSDNMVVSRTILALGRFNAPPWLRCFLGT
ncbi:hypothetical protein M408DRAFT_263892 [Serendipita vermifera MAFF 305830]|uniref:F-box domain-containing protein n=1 Tax=Serendipita vermifera MAFF 305830 TaxID=933852 RepID=A0A0C3AFD7_SERVB|nr:hypothetical protein M408DRAFT_263892 [Serendipita vermifera MAFF 305830]